MFMNDVGMHAVMAGLRGRLLGLGHRRSWEPVLSQVVPPLLHDAGAIPSWLW